jgi:hypothetical protein
MFRAMALVVGLCLIASPLSADDSGSHCNKSCVTGYDDRTYCLDSGNAQSQWPVMDGCEGGQTYCETIMTPTGPESSCQPICSGSHCYFV